MEKVLTEYRFDAFRSLFGGEVWATLIPAEDLRPEDAGSYVSVHWHPGEIAAGHRSWNTLDAVYQMVHQDGSGTRQQTALWIDGVEFTVSPRTTVWLGWHPDSNHQRGGFQR